MKNGRSSTFLALASLCISAQSGAAPAPSPAGHWKGAIQIPGQELPVEVDLAAKGRGAWVGTISIAAQNLHAFPLSSIDAQGEAVTFAMKRVPGEPTFKGRLSADGGSLSGDFMQSGAQLPFQLKRTGDAILAETPKSTAISKDLEGAWQGTVDAGGRPLRLELNLANQPEGGATGHLVSVDQGGAKIAITTITQTGSRLELALASILASYSGELKEGSLVGEWKQGPGTASLVFSRAKP
jgi:hypothetical protein